MSVALFELAALDEFGRRRADSATGDPCYADPGLVTDFLPAGEALTS